MTSSRTNASRGILRLTVATLAIGWTGIFLAGPASAHPLGNFTTNTYAGLELTEDVLVVHYVVDMAEVATLQELESAGLPDDGSATRSQLARYATEAARRLLSGIRVSIDEEPTELDIDDSRALLLPGEGGLDTLRVEVDYLAELPEAETTVSFADLNYGSRLGWKEVVAYTSGGQGIETSNVPSRSISNELRTYPPELLSEPIESTTATVLASPNARSVPREEGAGDVDDDLLGDDFASLIEGDVSPIVALGSIALAMGFGAVHALGPGHGKTVMAAYLSGTEGKVRHALAVGIAISLMHTSSVVVLGVVTLAASSLFRPEEVYPWLSLVSGAVVLALGVWLLWTRLGRGDDHSHHDHEHAPEPEASPLSRRGLVGLAVSGGLLPSPSALVVLLGAVALDRVTFGVLLVAAFSIGLAGALTLLGVVVIKTRSFASGRLGGRFGRALPVLSACVIVGVGALLTARAVAGL